MLRIDTISTHVQSAIGAPIQGVLLADQTSSVRPGVMYAVRRLVVEMVLGPLLVKEGHEVGEGVGLRLAQIAYSQRTQWSMRVKW